MNKIVVITGTTSGVGKCLKALFEANGDTVIGISRRYSDCERSYQADIKDAEAINGVFRDIESKYKRVDILINNAGYGLHGATELLPLNECENIMDINFNGALIVTQAALKIMDKGSKIIFISSTCALFALPFRSLYCASKAAMSILSQSLYMELKDAGIRVVDICPGEIKTGFSGARVKIASQNQRYLDKPQSAAQHIDSKEHKRMDCQKASKKIFKIIQSAKKPMYIVGFKYKVLYALKRILPTKLFLNMTKKFFSG